LGQDRPVIALQLPKLDATHETSWTVSSLATCLLNEITRLQTHGPYFLVGYSFGGSLGYEIAQQIIGRGERVALLVLCDADLDSPKLRPWIERLMVHSRLIAAMPLRDKIRCIGNALFTRLRRISNAQTEERPEAEPLDASHPLDQSKRWHEFASKLHASYVHQPYAGKIHILFARPRDAFEQMYWPKTLDYWLGLARGGIEAYEIHGAHLEIFDEPNVRHLAKLMSAILSEHGP
jgi:aspartate racemase